MVVFQGYCRPLKQKVEFQVESVNRLETKRGIKWSVKGNYGDNKISTFTNEENAQILLDQLNITIIEEPMEVFGAEIAYQEAENDDDELSSVELKTQRDLQELAKEIDDDDDDDDDEADDELSSIELKTQRDLQDLTKEMDAEDIRGGLTAKHYKKDGSLDLRYKICREIAATEKKNAEESKIKSKAGDTNVDDELEEIVTEAAVDEVLGSETWQGKSLAGSLDEIEEMLGRKKKAEESFDAENYQKVYRAEPNAIMFDENIPPEIWNIMGSDAQGHYLATRDETVLIAPCCGVTKAEIRVDNDANIECASCVFSGDDFHPRWWADKPVPKVRQIMDAEELPMEDLYGNTATVPADIYYRFMLQLPPTVSATPTDDGFSMILGFHNQNAEFVENLIEAYSPYEDAGDSQDTLYAEDISFVPKKPTGAVLTLNKFAEQLNKYEAEMTCPPATKDVAINTKNRNATIKNFGYGPLNVEEPGDFWEKIAKQWDTTEKAAKKSKCGNCVAFDRSPRMKACMPGETSDGEGVLGYCWMHHFKCHSARTCDTWAKGGPITTDKVSEGWQERAFAKPKASKIATEAGKATAKAAESFDVEFEEWGKQEMLTHGKNVSFKDWLEEEADSHGDMPLVEWAKDEEKSHDERYEADSKMHPDWCSNCGMKDDGCINLGYGDWYCMNFLDNRKTYDGRYDAESFRAEYTSTQIEDTILRSLNNMDLGEREYYVDLEKALILIKKGNQTSYRKAYDIIKKYDFSKDLKKSLMKMGDDSFEAESDKPVNKTLVGALGIGVLGAIFAPKYIKSIFDKIKKR